jgi:hypothetical protein
MDRNSYEPKYRIGQYYYTLEGKVVKIINDSERTEIGGKVARCVKGDDGVWRYDEAQTTKDGINYGDGRVTGSRSYPPDPRNFALGSWLKHPMKVIGAFGGRPLHTSNTGDLDKAKLICKELDRLYEIEANAIK